jgi:hypothetical protein
MSSNTLVAAVEVSEISTHITDVEGKTNYNHLYKLLTELFESREFYSKNEFCNFVRSEVHNNKIDLFTVIKAFLELDSDVAFHSLVTPAIVTIMNDFEKKNEKFKEIPFISPAGFMNNISYSSKHVAEVSKVATSAENAEVAKSAAKLEETKPVNIISILLPQKSASVAPSVTDSNSSESELFNEDDFKDMDEGFNTKRATSEWTAVKNKPVKPNKQNRTVYNSSGEKVILSGGYSMPRSTSEPNRGSGPGLVDALKRLQMSGKEAKFIFSKGEYGKLKKLDANHNKFITSASWLFMKAKGLPSLLPNEYDMYLQKSEEYIYDDGKTVETGEPIGWYQCRKLNREKNDYNYWKVQQMDIYVHHHNSDGSWSHYEEIEQNLVEITLDYYLYTITPYPLRGGAIPNKHPK